MKGGHYIRRLVEYDVNLALDRRHSGTVDRYRVAFLVDDRTDLVDNCVVNAHPAGRDE